MVKQYRSSYGTDRLNKIVWPAYNIIIVVYMPLGLVGTRSNPLPLGPHLRDGESVFFYHITVKSVGVSRRHIWAY